MDNMKLTPLPVNLVNYAVRPLCLLGLSMPCCVLVRVSFLKIRNLRTREKYRGMHPVYIYINL